MFNVEVFLLLVSSTLFLSYISGLFYTKTKIPDIVWLLLFGYLLGPVLKFFDKGMFLAMFPLIILVVVAIFSFDTGINVDISAVIGSVHKSLTLTISTFVAIVLAVGLFLNLLMPDQFNLLEGMLLGALIGGLGGISVSGILDRLRTLMPSIGKDTVILNLESTLSDPIRLVACLTLIKMITLQGVTLEDGLKDILFTFTTSSIFGVAGGLLWAEVLNLLKERPFNYIMTIAALFPLYIISEEVISRGGGPITALAFGLAITNYGYVSRRLGSKRRVLLDKRRIREFNQEITFLVKAFFFVYLGLIVSLSAGYAIIGGAIILLVLAVRYAVATGVSRFLRFTDGERVLSRVIFMQGASPLILAQLPIIHDLEGLSFRAPEIYGDLCFPIVLGTIVLVSILGPVIAREQLRYIELT